MKYDVISTLTNKPLARRVSMDRAREVHEEAHGNAIIVDERGRPVGSKDVDPMTASPADKVNTMTWNWTIDAMNSLRDIAREAREASKTGNLKRAIEMRAVEKAAIAGSLVVAKIFGDVKGG